MILKTNYYDDQLIINAYKRLASEVLKTVIKDGYMPFFNESNDFQYVLYGLAQTEKQFIYEKSKKVDDKRQLTETRKKVIKTLRGGEKLAALHSWFDGTHTVKEICANTGITEGYAYWILYTYKDQNYKAKKDLRNKKDKCQTN